MATMYFAKLNINSKIYDIYRDQEKYFEILDSIFYSLDDSKAVVDESGIEYKLNSLLKDEKDIIIAGRLSKIYDGEIEIFDRNKNQPRREKTDDLSLSVNFCFDIRNEIIAYTIPLGFGYKQFLDVFKKLLELYVNEVEFEIMLLTNVGDLREKISSLKKVTKVSITLVPPNPPNMREFRELFGNDRADDIIESGGTRYQETVEVSTKSEEGIKQGRLFERGYNAAEKGYGTITAIGCDANDNTVTITSESNAPLKKYINDSQKNNIEYIFNKGKEFISRLIGILY